MVVCIHPDILSSIITGIIANILFTLILIYGVQQFRYWYFLKRKYNNKTFHSFWKRFPEDAIQEINCKVRGNKIIFSGKSLNKKISGFDGQFIINPVNLKYGEGYHFHEHTDGFAFSKIIIRDDSTFFVDVPYTGVKENNKQRKVGYIVYQAFIWKLIENKI